ncbi:mechanosensitive ion channel family protein [Tautonia rosea]|uniref:mechanosensitive ion channel family protein n=1 Tax=Tautonia rosea TaxID=2728037 RepID=UPI0014744776|nr:mechanosensitive ion channel family protein [Tautonia rosea]
MSRTRRSSRPPNQSARAFGGVVVVAGVIFTQAEGLGTSAPSLDALPQIRDSASEVNPAPISDPPADVPSSADPAVAGAPSADSVENPELVPTGFQTDDAELIARLERLLRTNREELAKQKTLIEDRPDSDYSRAEREFNQLDEQFKKTEEALQAALNAGETETAAKLQSERDDLARRRDLAKDRFELEVRERKAAKEQVDILSKAIESDEQRLRELLGDEPEPPGDEPAEEPSPPADAPPADAPPAAETPAPSAEPEATEPAPAEPALTPTLPGIPSITSTQEAQPTPAPPVREEVAKAQKEVETRADVAAKAERRSQSLDERLDLINRKIASTREQLATAQRKADNARETRNVLSEEFREKSFNGAPREALQALRSRIAEADKAVMEATAEVRDRTARLEEVHEERALISEAREAVTREAAEARLALEVAQATLRETTNPFSLQNISRWLVERGPGILIILVLASFLIWIINRFGSRVASLMAQRSNRGSLAEREDRSRTLVSVFENASSAIIIIGAGLMALDYAGVPIAPLLGGAAVLGLAISFGAQNLVSDFFYGFMILLENQYKLNDVVRINEHSGQVERITLRMTALRDIEGNLHFIPNGQITSVINMTHGWSRALFDIGVAYKENVDHVMEVILELGKELRRDPKFRPLILEDPTMLGVDGFADSAVMIKFFIKTRPLQQWVVKRELLRRMKNRFDELGIEIPFPHRTVYHRTDDPALSRFSVSVEPTLGSDNGHTPSEHPV